MNVTTCRVLGFLLIDVPPLLQTVAYLHKELLAAGFKAEALHGQRSQEEREAALRGFRAGKAQVLVATDVAARGLHVRALPYIVNYDFPGNLETYIHRVGRTGARELNTLRTAMLLFTMFGSINECAEERSSDGVSVSHAICRALVAAAASGSASGIHVGVAPRRPMTVPRVTCESCPMPCCRRLCVCR